MNWKQILITAVVTLIITIISGVVVNWYTYAVENKPKESLVYEVKSIAQFDSDSTDISIFTLEVFNEGIELAENVEVKITYGEESEVIDSKGVIERTNESIKTTRLSNNSLSYKISKLFPDDRFFLNVAFKDLPDQPQIIVQSSNSLGLERKVAASEKNEERLKWLMILRIVLLAGFSLALMFFIIRKITRLRKDLNNTGFLFLHKGQLDFAQNFLDKAMDKGANYFELSNYALTLCLKNNGKYTYNSLMEMAEFLAGKDDFQILFTKMLIAAKEKDYTGFQSYFEKAYKKKKSRFRLYYDYSRILNNLAAEDIELLNRKSQLEKDYNL